MEKIESALTCLYRKCMLVLLLIPFAGNAQTLSLYDAVTNAVKNYPLLQQRRAEIEAGRSHIRSVNGQRLPSLTLQDQLDMGTLNKLPGTYLTYGMVPSIPGGNTSSPAQNNNLNMNNIGVSSLQWNIFNFGYYNALEKEAKKQLAVNEANFGGDKYTITENIISLYLDWLKKFRIMQIQKENVQRAKVIFTAIRATVLSGLKPGVDSSTASASYADAQIAYLQAEDDFNADQISMGAYTGMSTVNLVPDSTFITAVLSQNITPALQDTVSVSHPLLNIYQKQYEVQLADIKSISRKYMPHVGLEGDAWINSSGIPYSGVYPENPFYGMPYSKYNYLFGATITYNLFDLKHRQNEMAESRDLAQARLNALQNQQVSLTSVLRQANSSYATTQQKLKAVPVQLLSARQAYEQQLALYRAGLNTLIDLTNAQYVLLQAETNYVILQDQLLQLTYLRAGLDGQLDSFLQNTKR